MYLAQKRRYMRINIKANKNRIHTRRNSGRKIFGLFICPSSPETPSDRRSRCYFCGQRQLQFAPVSQDKPATRRWSELGRKSRPKPNRNFRGGQKSSRSLWRTSVRRASRRETPPWTCRQYWNCLWSNRSPFRGAWVRPGRPSRRRQNDPRDDTGQTEAIRISCEVRYGPDIEVFSEDLVAGISLELPTRIGRRRGDDIAGGINAVYMIHTYMVCTAR